MSKEERTKMPNRGTESPEIAADCIWASSAPGAVFFSFVKQYGD
jgi:hypothetical protein